MVNSPCFESKLFAFLKIMMLHVLVLTSRDLHKKSCEVSFKTRSTPSSLSFKGQATKHSTAKIIYWVIVEIKKHYLVFRTHLLIDCTLFLIFLARLAYFRVFKVSMKSRSEGDTHAIIKVRLRSKSKNTVQHWLAISKLLLLFGQWPIFLQV